MKSVLILLFVISLVVAIERHHLTQEEKEKFAANVVKNSGNMEFIPLDPPKSPHPIRSRRSDESSQPEPIEVDEPVHSEATQTDGEGDHQ